MNDPRSSPKGWTAEEDRKVIGLLKEGTTVFDIYANHFQHRSLMAVTMRVSWANKAMRAQERQAQDGVLPGEIDIAKSIAGEKGAPPLRTVYNKIVRAARAQRRKSDKSEDTVQRSDITKDRSPRKGAWKREEDEMLRVLVQRNKDIPQPKIWNLVAGGNVGGSLLLRSSGSCACRWQRLYPSPSRQTGPWTKEEELRLQKAISKQFEGKYQVVVDVLVGKPVATENILSVRKPERAQLPGQEGLPILKLGSRRLRDLNWARVEEMVKTRTEFECRDHFYSTYHNGGKGRWSGEEVARLKEGMEMFGKDSWKLAEYVGTRSPSQVSKCIYYLKKSNPEAVEGTKEKKKDDAEELVDNTLI
ncbi:Myblike DNAbinding domain-containing protein [Linnemannia exigua]|uniref:Myblike DNAbinding domain-containing protein n=1 Tax=Linnemannia exigua TaxID=604196 RepID=A0AAD4H521_9FUNG|nr:Myblike DNAbinding domain-containing protein [Linnemannia exigua]